MKIDRLETHDRLDHFKKDQADNIFSGIDDCLKRNPDCVEMQQYFPWVYIFCHPRTADNGVDKVMYWQPRLEKPKAQTNSYLFRVISNTDITEIVWMLPPRELWPQFESGKVLENPDVITSIINFSKYRDELEAPHPDDWSSEKIIEKLKEIELRIKFEKSGFKLL